MVFAVRVVLNVPAALGLNTAVTLHEVPAGMDWFAAQVPLVLKFGSLEVKGVPASTTAPPFAVNPMVVKQLAEIPTPMLGQVVLGALADSVPGTAAVAVPDTVAWPQN